MDDEEKEPAIVFAEYGENENLYGDNEFQDYVFSKTGEQVTTGTPIGCEVFNPRTKEWELKLFSDIRFG
jgi:hypothetical protein